MEAYTKHMRLLFELQKFIDQYAQHHTQQKKNEHSSKLSGRRKDSRKESLRHITPKRIPQPNRAKKESRK